MCLSRNRIPQKAQIEWSLSRSPWCRLCLLSCRGGLQSTTPQTFGNCSGCVVMLHDVRTCIFGDTAFFTSEAFREIQWYLGFYSYAQCKKHLVKCMISATVWSQSDVAPLLRFQDVVPLIWIGDWTNEVPWFAIRVCLKMGVPREMMIGHEIFFGIPYSQTTFTRGSFCFAGNLEDHLKAGLWNLPSRQCPSLEHCNYHLDYNQI